MDASALSLASDAELIQELARRTVAVDGRAMVTALVRPDQDSSDCSNFALVAAANESNMSQEWLRLIIATICDRFGVRISEDGSCIEVPPIASLGED